MSLSVPPSRVWRFVQSVCPDCYPFMFDTASRVVVRDPVTLTSWWRSNLDNARVGGRETSQHLWAMALDLAGPGAVDAGDQLRSMGWTVIDEGSHVHAQVFRSNPLANVTAIV